MGWFGIGTNKRLNKLEQKVEGLELQNKLLVISLQNIQTSLLTAAKQSEGVAREVREIQDLINSILQQAEQASILYGLDPADGYEH